MPDKITQITNLLVGLKENSVAELRDDTDKVVERIEKLLAGCSDNSQVVIAYDRSQLDAFIQTEFEEYGLTNFESSDKQWEQAWNTIQDNDTAWTYMSDACYEAETNLGQQVHEGEDSDEYPTHYILGSQLRKDSDE